MPEEVSGELEVHDNAVEDQKRQRKQRLGQVVDGVNRKISRLVLDSFLPSSADVHFEKKIF